MSWKKWKVILIPWARNFCRFEKYLLRRENNTTYQVLEAAHNYASHWEFALIENINPQGFEMQEIASSLKERMLQYRDLLGMQVQEKNVKSAQEISEKYNKNCFNPRDEELLRAVDHLAAFVEARVAIDNGGISPGFLDAAHSLRSKYRGSKIAGLKFGELYADF